MSSRLALSNTSALSMSPVLPTHDIIPSSPSEEKAWVNPTSLPSYPHPTYISGNAPESVKQLTYNTFMAYGVGDEDSFGARVGRAVRFTEVNVNRKMERHGRLEATTIAEVEVVKHMLNGAGMLHGACLAYLIDNCCSTPLVVLGLLQNVNGVGVTQSMTVLFHSPAPRGTCLQVVSTSMTLGGRVMSSRCEILDKNSGRLVASASMSKMQPTASKL